VDNVRQQGSRTFRTGKTEYLKYKINVFETHTQGFPWIYSARVPPVLEAFTSGFSLQHVSITVAPFCLPHFGAPKANFP
jgi:hypothetical protein